LKSIPGEDHKNLGCLPLLRRNPKSNHRPPVNFSCVRQSVG
jgi:hypothetical protein